MKKSLLILLILFISISFLFIGYNFGISKTGSFKDILESSQEHHSPPSVIIEPGSGVEEASYIIFHDDETPKNYYAKNGKTGEIEFQGTDASQIINWCRGNLADGGVIFLRNGNYSITTPLLFEGDNEAWRFSQEYRLIGESINGVTLVGANGVNVIELTNQVRVTIANMRINSNNAHGIYGYEGVTREASTSWSFFDNLQMYVSGGTDKWCIYLRNSDMNVIQNFRGKAQHANCGVIKLETLSSATYSYGNMVFLGETVCEIAEDNTIAILLTGTSSKLVEDIRVKGRLHLMGWSPSTNQIALWLNYTRYVEVDAIHSEHMDTIIKVQNSYSNIICANSYNFPDDQGTYIDIDSNSYMNTFRDFYIPTVSAGKTRTVMVDRQTSTTRRNVFEGFIIACDPSSSGFLHFNVSAVSVCRQFKSLHLKATKKGFKSEYGGATMVANGEWIMHYLFKTPVNVQITPKTATYDGVPVNVYWIASNSSHFQVGVYWVNGTAITDDAVNIYWQAWATDQS